MWADLMSKQLPVSTCGLMTLHCGFFGQLSELRGEVSRLQAEKEELERELDTRSNHTHKQVQEHALTVCVCMYVPIYMCINECMYMCDLRYQRSSLRSRLQSLSSRICRNLSASHRMQSRAGWWVTWNTQTTYSCRFAVRLVWSTFNRPRRAFSLCLQYYTLSYVFTKQKLTGSVHFHKQLKCTMTQSSITL